MRKTIAITILLLATAAMPAMAESLILPEAPRSALETDVRNLSMVAFYFENCKPENSEYRLGEPGKPGGRYGNLVTYMLSSFSMYYGRSPNAMQAMSSLTGNIAVQMRQSIKKMGVDKFCATADADEGLQAVVKRIQAMKDLKD